MADFQHLVNPTDSHEPMIDLESSGIIDLENLRLCGGQSVDEATPQQMEIVERQANPRCATSEREILRSTFTNL